METILHITDLHFGWEGDNPSDKAERKVCLDGLLTEISKLQPPWKPSIVCLTGDVAWHGAACDYAEAKEWLDLLLSHCNLNYDRLIVSPGNHDVNRKIAEKIPRPNNSDEADKALKPPLEQYFIRPFSEFNDFCTNSNIPALKFGGGESHLVGQRALADLRFVVLNSSWFSKDNEDKARLWFGLPHMKYLEAHQQLPVLQFDGKEPITIALAHHPAEWLHADEQHVSGTRPNPQDYLARRCHVLLTGHTHGEVRRADRIAEGAWHFTGGSAYAGASHFNSFRLLQIKPDQIVYRSFEFDPRSSENKWKSSEVVSLPLVVESPVAQPVSQVERKLKTADLRAAFRADAVRMLERKSRLLRPFGKLPQNVPQQVSVRVSAQHQKFSPEGRLLREKRDEDLMPFYEAVRVARRVLLLGDLGSGKSTLAATLVIETIDRSETAVATCIPVKSLRLAGQFTLRELLQSIDDYIIKEVLPRFPEVKLISLLEDQIEVLLVLDGLDELSRDVAARLLRQAAILPEHWPTIQVAVTARPVELVGVSYADWRVVHTLPLDDTTKRQFIKEELIADGADAALVDEKATALLRSLKEMPALDSLANSPLSIRLIYPRLSPSSSNKSLTLGDLLYELLLERLGGWQKRDDKPSTLDHFDAILPTPEAKAEFLSILAQKAGAVSQVTVDEAKAILEDAATSLTGANKHRLAEEALTCFEWLGLIVKGDLVEFPLQPLAEVSAAIGLLKQWKSHTGDWKLPEHSQWRIVSFAAAIARRRGWLVELREPILRFIDSLLRRASNLPAACYIVVETADNNCAEKTVQIFPQLGYRPLTLFGDERRASARNVAKTIWLAGDTGFDWLFSQYLDPRYPIPTAGIATIEEVFKEWAALVRGQLKGNQRQRLAKLVMPYLATGEGDFIGVLSVLAVLVPEAFGLEDRLWYQSLELDSLLFGDWVNEQFVVLGTRKTNQVLLSNLLLHRAVQSPRAGILWFDLNPGVAPPVSMIRAAFQSVCRQVGETSAIRFVAECRKRLGDEEWLRFARWMLTVEDTTVASGAAIVLHDFGELRLAVLGDVLMRAMHDGGYVAEAEKVLAALVRHEGEKGVRWLASRISMSNEWLGAHSGWWRVLLNEIEQLDDGPQLLAACALSMGPFTLPRHPEVREAFSRVLNGPRGTQFRDVLRARLQSLNPEIRRGASLILIATDPRTEGEALFVAIRSRAKERISDWHEWESFCLTLDFTPSILALLKSRLHLLEPNSRTLALALLAKGGLEIESAYRTELVSNLLTLGNWHLARDPIGKSMLGAGDSLGFLVAQLDHPGSEIAERAADQLLNVHRSRLSPKIEAKCIALHTKPSGWSWDLAKVMARVTRSPEFALSIKEASEEIRGQGGSTPFLELVLRANIDPSAWKDVVWAMLCDDTRLGGSSEADASGFGLLEYGLEVKEQRKSIGQAASECLSDPRMRSNRWTDAYHWLAVIADEFAGLTSDVIQGVLKHGHPISCCAATALIARLGEVPKGVVFDHGVRRRPASFPGAIQRETNADRLMQRLEDYSRDSDELHPALFSTIEECLFLPTLTDQTLSGIASKGKPGALISTTLRFCYGLPNKLAETLPLLDIWAKIWREEESKPHLKRLHRIWMIVRESVIRDDEKAGSEYLIGLDTKLLEGSIWRLPLASEILRIRGYLLKEQVQPVFLEYAGQPTFLHEALFGRLAEWLAGEIDETLRNTVLSAANEAIVVLNETSWDSSGGWHPNTWAYLLFPPVQWALSGQTSAASEAAFLRGLKFAFDQPTRPQQAAAIRVVLLFSYLEPLLKKAPSNILGATIRAGLDASDPAVRALCRLIQSFADFVTIDRTVTPKS
jgi:hypothetical protein